MMKRKWWQSPEMILLYGIFGAIAGVVVAIFLFDFLIFEARVALHANEGWQLASSGVGGGFIGVEKIVFSSVLGALTGCALVHIRGKYRSVMGCGLSTCSGIVAFIAITRASEHSDSAWHRFELSLYGSYCVWSLLLIIGGIWMTWRDPKYL